MQCDKDHENFKSKHHKPRCTDCKEGLDSCTVAYSEDGAMLCRDCARYRELNDTK